MTSAKLKKLRTRAQRWLKHPVAPQAEFGEVTGALRSRDLRRMRKPAEYFLGMVAVVALGYCTAQYSAAAIHQSHQNARLDALRAQSAQLDKTLDATPTLATDQSAPPPIGRIEIPSVGVSAIVEEGESNATLSESVGHLTGTAKNSVRKPTNRAWRRSIRVHQSETLRFLRADPQAHSDR